MSGAQFYHDQTLINKTKQNHAIGNVDDTAFYFLYGERKHLAAFNAPVICIPGPTRARVSGDTVGLKCQVLTSDVSAGDVLGF